MYKFVKYLLFIFAFCSVTVKPTVNTLRVNQEFNSVFFSKKTGGKLGPVALIGTSQAFGPTMTPQQAQFIERQIRAKVTTRKKAYKK